MMKRFSLSLFGVVFLFGTQIAEGAVIFTEDVTFVDGDVYWAVEIHGGAHAEVLGGLFENRFQLYDDSTATLLGGDFGGGLAMQDSSRASIHPGAYINTYIFMHDSANLDIYGGRMPARYLDATTGATDPLVTFHGYNLVLEPTGGNWGYGYVTGMFADSSPFTVHLYGGETASRVRLNIIPEPSTFIVWSLLGSLGITVGWCRRRRQAA